MKSIKYIIVLVCFAITATIQAQTADEIIAKHIKAHGGIENWKKVDALAIHGIFTAFSVEKEFYALKTKNGEYFSDLYLGHDKKVKEGHDGKQGWVNDPWFQIPYAREANTAETNALNQKKELITPFFNYKERGFTVESLGKKNVEGIDCYVLKLTRTNGQEETWYLDASTYLEVKCESTLCDFGSPSSGETFFEDFREVNGLIFPFFTERMFSQRDRILVIDKIEINPEYNSKVFKMPSIDQFSKLAFMAGSWDVTIESKGRDGKWNIIGKNNSEITYKTANLIEQQLRYENFYSQNVVINYSFHQVSQLYQMTVYNELSPGLKLMEGSFKDGTFIFDNKLIAKEGEQLVQMAIFDIGENTFKMEMRGSRDKGETWNASLRFTYSKN